MEEETDLSAWNDQIINCGFTGVIKPENKEAIMRSEKNYKLKLLHIFFFTSSPQHYVYIMPDFPGSF